MNLSKQFLRQWRSLWALGACLALGIMGQARAEKIWMSPVSSFWDIGTNWSGGMPPDDTAFIRITNDLSKTITIDGLTPATNLTVQKLTLSAPPGATNTLLVTDLGPTNPFVMQTGLEMEDGAVFRITNSALLLQLTNDHVNIDGSMILDSGSIDFGDITVTARVGRVTSGALTINSGTISAGVVYVGGTNLSFGAVYMNGGTFNVGDLFSVGRDVSTTGAVFVVGGQLNVPNDDTRIGDFGVGQMTISNATAWLTNFTIGRYPTASGSFTLQSGGSVLASNDVSIARFNGSSGTAFVSGGQLKAIGSKIFVGREGSGQMTISGGTVEASGLLVAANNTNSSSGSLSMSGGSLNLASRLAVGSASVSPGQVILSGGAASVTNSASSAVVTVADGGLSMSGGNLTVDNLVLTNSGGTMTFNSGTLTTKSTTVANGAAFVVGNGVDAATLYLAGGTHSFANGLVISSNATLTGCGTIIGTISNSGVIATNCGSGGVGPSITTQPQNLTVTNGNNASFTVVATGNPAPTYQWQKNNGNIAGATRSSYTITGAALGDEGSYTVVVANSVNSITSSAATLTVLVAPSITTPPQSLTVTNGSNASFTVVATGNPAPTYQWQKNNGNIAGATRSSYTITGAALGDEGSYTVVVANSVNSITSSAATLTVLVAPSITTPPQSLTVNTGANATFSVVATGNPAPTYQWQKNNANITGATGTAYTITGVTTNDAGNFTVVVANSVNSITSSVATLTVRVTQVTPLTLSLPAFGAGAFSFDITGPSGTNYVVLRSTDLVHWTPIRTNFTSTGTVHFSDASPPAVGAFYRSMLSP
jgi:T5SS/PEP-CTERM-associated repeat protein